MHHCSVWCLLLLCSRFTLPRVRDCVRWLAAVVCSYRGCFVSMKVFLGTFGGRIHLARRFSSCMRGVDETIQLIGIRSSQSVLSRLAFERSVVDISCGSFALRRRDTPGRSCVSLLIYIAPTISFTHHFHSHHTVSISHHHSSGQTR